MLNIARTIHAGFPVAKSKYDLPEVEIIPFGIAPNERKKLENAATKYLSLPDYDNVPLPGFTLYKSDKKKWGSTDSTWLVIDPRGFLVRITSANVEDILHVTGITEGLIQQECIWARENTETKMILVPVSSPLYISATKNTELLENKIDLSDVQIGDTVLLQNEIRGIYRGVMSFYGNMVATGSKKYKPLANIRRQVIEVDIGRYYYQSDLKILKIISRTTNPMTREESVDAINRETQASTAFFSQSLHKSGVYFGIKDGVRFVSALTTPKVKMIAKSITKEEAGEIYCQAAYASDIGRLVLEHAQGHKYLVDYPYAYYRSGNPLTPQPTDAFDVVRLLDCKTSTFEYIETDEGRKYSISTTSPKFKLDNFVKFYKIEKHVKNNIYI